jgi:opacity protein-like surface antigen
MRLPTLCALGAALVCALCVAPAANAAPSDPNASHIYLAADAGYLVSPGGGGSGTIVTAGIGYRLDRYFAIEGGYAGIFANGSASGAYADGFVYQPLGRYSPLSVFATGGVSYIASGIQGGYGYSPNAFGFRGGAGLEWQFNDLWALRTTARYQSTIKSAAVISVGLTAHF